MFFNIAYRLPLWSGISRILLVLTLGLVMYVLAYMFLPDYRSYLYIILVVDLLSVFVQMFMGWGNSSTPKEKNKKKNKIIQQHIQHVPYNQDLQSVPPQQLQQQQPTQQPKQPIQQPTQQPIQQPTQQQPKQPTLQPQEPLNQNNTLSQNQVELDSQLKDIPNFEFKEQNKEENKVEHDDEESLLIPVYNRSNK